MALPALATSISSVLGGFGGLSGGGGEPADTIAVRTGPVTTSVGSGAMFEARDSWMWLVIVALVLVALFKWK